MRVAPKQLNLFTTACRRCPVQDCADKDIDDRACSDPDLQSPGSSALSHRSPQLPALLDALQDFRIPESLFPASQVELAPYIPQIDPYSPLLSEMPGTVAITLSEFISPSGSSYKKGIKKAHLLRLGGSKMVVLVGTSRDKQLEAVWKEPTCLIEAIQEAKIDLVLGPAFSIYLGRLPLERNANRSRNFWLYQRFREASIEAIPAAGFIDVEDAAQTANWIQRLQLSSIFLDLQSADSPRSWSLVQDSLPKLVESAGGLERVVVNGVGQPDRVLQLAQLIRPLKMVLTNGSAFQLARGRWDYFSRDTRLVKCRCPSSPEHIFANFAAFYSSVSSGQQRRYISLSLQPRIL